MHLTFASCFAAFGIAKNDLNFQPNRTMQLSFDASRSKDLILNAPLPLHYNITKTGLSTLRNIDGDELRYLRMNQSSKRDTISDILGPLMMLVHADDFGLDKAHEMILGVNETNIKEAEFAATNRGKTSWSKDHPLSDDQDMLHSIIHRLEGGHIGEGGYTGYENAKYWLFGGDKMLECVKNHEIRERLKQYVQENNHLQEMSLIANETKWYDIIAGGGNMRKVFVRKGEFDFIRYYDLCELLQEGHLPGLKNWNSQWLAYTIELQQVEIHFIFEHASMNPAQRE